MSDRSMHVLTGKVDPRKVWLGKLGNVCPKVLQNVKFYPFCSVHQWGQILLESWNVIYEYIILYKQTCSHGVHMVSLYSDWQLFY